MSDIKISYDEWKKENPLVVEKVDELLEKTKMFEEELKKAYAEGSNFKRMHKYLEKNGLKTTTTRIKKVLGIETSKTTKKRVSKDDLKKFENEMMAKYNERKVVADVVNWLKDEKGVESNSTTVRDVLKLDELDEKLLQPHVDAMKKVYEEQGKEISAVLKWLEENKQIKVAKKSIQKVLGIETKKAK